MDIRSIRCVACNGLMRIKAEENGKIYLICGHCDYEIVYEPVRKEPKCEGCKDGKTH